MHDPMSVALEIKSPFKSKPSQWWPKGYRSTIVTIWHKDPEKDGSDDSCDWFGWKRPLSQEEKAIFEAKWDLESVLDNRPYYPDDPAHKRFQELKRAIQQLKRRKGWRIHPRWHFWHWEIQIQPLAQLKRMLFSRCCKCPKRFKYGESVTTTSWNGTGPRWFRGEANVYHSWHDGVAMMKADN